MDTALVVLRELFGVLQPNLVFMCVVKIQSLTKVRTNVYVTLDMVFEVTNAKIVLMDTS